MFRNRRLPTTIYSSSTLVVTEIQTITSTLPSFEPSSLFRLKREVGIENDLQSTVVEPQSVDKEIHPTRPLTSTPVISLPGSNEPAIDIDRLMLILNQPEIQEAWNKFLQVLSKVLEWKEKERRTIFRFYLNQIPRVSVILYKFYKYVSITIEETCTLDLAFPTSMVLRKFLVFDHL